MDIMTVFEKVVKGETKKINRHDECILWTFLAHCVGEKNVLTELLWDEEKHDIKYFGCAVFIDDTWKVYNLVGTGGVVIYIGFHPRLAMKVGD